MRKIFTLLLLLPSLLYAQVVYEHISKNIGGYSSLRDNYESKPFTKPDFFNQWQGAPQKAGPEDGIEYSDMNVHLAYLIPFLFYKSVDHTLNGTNAAGQTGQNSQLFIDVSSRNIKNLHLFLTVFVDEFSMKRVSEVNIPIPSR